MNKKSEKRAWIVAGISSLVSLILLGGYFYILPLKEKVPYVVMADTTTGTSTISRLSGNFDDSTITASEAINKSDLSRFLLARESYDKPMIGLRDWRTVYAMSSGEVSNAYKQWLDEGNPESPIKLYADAKAIRIRILSIVLDAKGSSGQRKSTIRFQRSLFDKTSGQSTALDNKIATIGYTYKSNLKMDDADRLENPLGFQVSAYNVNNDYSTITPTSTAPGAQVTSANNVEAGAEQLPAIAAPAAARTTKGVK